MSSYTLYHNPRCSKSRQTLQLLREQGIEPTIVEYLKHPPSAETLNQLLDQLGLTPRELMRRKEPPYQTLDLGNETHSREQLVEAMVANPILIERPILVVGERAAIGRPPENVLDLLDP